VATVFESDFCRTMPNCLTPQFRYEKMAEMAGGKGFFCETIEEVQAAMKAALEVR
jgi:thiamine pyrophosphate-dependent acetolactate synthase large subunit-like protein